MGLVNTLRKQVDLPIWEWMRFAPAVSSAISCSTAADNSNFHPQHGRYIYYLIAATSFWRYDTWTDTYMQLSSPPIAPATWSSMRFGGSMGVEGLALGGTTNTITLPAYSGKTLKSFDIRIIGGTGAGQRRTISDVAEPITVDQGVPTAVNNVLGAITITDATKAWTVNQWAGYQVRITFGPGTGQVRRILYNSATVLTLADTAISAQCNWSNPMIFAPAISAAAGTQSMYAIESSVCTVDVNWATIPDATSVFRIESGMLALASSAAATPFYTLQFYDVAADLWYIRTATTGNIAVVGTDGTIERTTENASLWERGTATSGTTTTLVDTTKSWDTNQWAGYYVRLFGGTGDAQLRQIVSNTNNTLTWTTVGTAPDTTSDYLIDGFDSGTVTSAASTTLVDSTKTWPVGRWNNYAVRITGGTGRGQLMSILKSDATSVTLVKPWAVTPDTTSVYNFQGDSDKIYMMLGANAATLIYNSDDDLPAYGRLADSGRACNAVVTYAASKPIAITSASHATTTATITTVQPHCLKVGYSITVKGMTDANYNTTATILTVPSTTTFTYTMAGTPAADTVTGSQSTTTLCDKTKNWTINQWAGFMVYMNTTALTAATGLATGQALQIVSNTADTLTFVAGTAPVNGVSRYVITPRSVIGTIDHGICTGTQSTTLLTDTNKSGSFTGSITINTAVLTVSTTPAGVLMPGTAITHASIPAGAVILNQLTGTTGGQGTYTISANATATVTGGTINYAWVVNAFAGKKCKLIGGTGQSQEFTINSNTANTLVMTAITTAPVTLVTSYVILQAPVRGTGIALNWFFGLSNPLLRGKYIGIARGGGVVGFDKLDITTDQWNLMPITPQLETLSSGSMYTYDGGDRFYFTKDVTQRVYYIDFITNTVHGAGQYPYAAGAVIIGNRMEIFETSDGLKYLWLNRHSQAECYRQLLFY